MVAPLSNATRRILLVLSIILIVIGNCGGQLITRLYFVKGGRRIWLACLLQSVGFPIILIPLLVSYSRCRKTYGHNTRLIYIQFHTFMAASVIGVLLGGSNYLLSFAAARLPVSTGTLILSTELVFLAFSAFVLVKQKFTSYSVNAVVLLTVGALTLALHASSDRPEGESQKDYILGFIMAFLAAASNGLIFPLVELVYVKARQALSYSLVMEIQMVLGFVGTVFAVIGMLANKDFKAIPKEARAFELGEERYYVVLVSSAIVGQLFILGAVGLVFCSSALVSGVIVSLMLPVSQVLAVVFFHDKFTPEKGISLVLCLWGSISYFYGERKERKKKKKTQIHESPTNSPNIASASEREP